MKYFSPKDLVGTPLEGVYPSGFCVASPNETQPAEHGPKYRAIPGAVDNFCRLEAAALGDSPRRELTLHKLMLQSVIHWKPF